MLKQFSPVWRRKMALFLLSVIITMLLMPLVACAESASLPQTSLPDVSLSDTSLPDVSLSDTSLPSTSLSGTNLSKTTVPITSLLDPRLGKFDLPNSTAPNVPISGPQLRKGPPVLPEPPVIAPVFTTLSWVNTFGWVYNDKILPTAYASLAHGYSLNYDGKYVYAKGARYFNEALSSWGNRFTMDGRVSGTKYLPTHPDVANYFSVKGSVLSNFKTSYNFTNPEYWKGMKKGSGGLWSLATVALDTYDYYLGNHREVGVTNTTFAASVITDVGTGMLTGALSTAAGVWAGAMAGAMAGSVVPGVGTIVGLVVGLGLSALLTTKTGQSLTNGVKAGVKVGLDWSGERAKEIWSGTKSLAQGASNFVGSLFH